MKTVAHGQDWHENHIFICPNCLLKPEFAQPNCSSDRLPKLAAEFSPSVLRFGGNVKRHRLNYEHLSWAAWKLSNLSRVSRTTWRAAKCELSVKHWIVCHHNWVQGSIPSSVLEAARQAQRQQEVSKWTAQGTNLNCEICHINLLSQLQDCFPVAPHVSLYPKKHLPFRPIRHKASCPMGVWSFSDLHTTNVHLGFRQ